MKSVFLVLIFFSVSIIKAQNYVPFPTDSARWRVSVYSGALGCPPLVAEYQYAINGDTNISSTTYKQIFRIGYTNNGFCYYGPWGYVGGIREDGNKHIFLRLPNAGSDTLLYDFNLAVGDTVKSYLNNCTGTITVVSIDSILIQTTYRKRFNLDGCFATGASLIEGIGSTKGLLDWTSTFETGGYLNCFVLNGQTIYPDTTNSCPLLIEGIFTKESPNCKVNILNIQNLSGVQFTTDAGFCSYSSIEIYNSLGCIVKSFYDKNLLPLTISSDEIGNGLFFARFTNETGQQYTCKFILR